MQKFAVAMLAASAFASGAWAQALPAPELSAKAWLLLDETSGQVIASHAATARIEPASLTKIMTAYIVFGALQDGTLKPEQKVHAAWGAGGQLEDVPGARLAGHGGQSVARADGAVGQ